MICKEEFVLEEKLGSGVFADVYKGHWKNNINVAIKVIKCGTSCYYYLMLEVGVMHTAHLQIPKKEKNTYHQKHSVT